MVHFKEQRLGISSLNVSRYFQIRSWTNIRYYFDLASLMKSLLFISLFFRKFIGIISCVKLTNGWEEFFVLLLFYILYMTTTVLLNYYSINNGKLVLNYGSQRLYDWFRRNWRISISSVTTPAYAPTRLSDLTYIQALPNTSFSAICFMYTVFSYKKCVLKMTKQYCSMQWLSSVT